MRTVTPARMPKTPPRAIALGREGGLYWMTGVAQRHFPCGQEQEGSMSMTLQEMESEARELMLRGFL